MWDYEESNIRYKRSLGFGVKPSDFRLSKDPCSVKIERILKKAQRINRQERRNAAKAYAMARAINNGTPMNTEYFDDDDLFLSDF